MKIAIGGDRCGFYYKKKLIQYLKKRNYEVKDVGTYQYVPSDSPVFAAEVGKLVASGECAYGVLVCATGTGISIAANKIKGVMCGIGYDDEVTKKMREHNAANVIAFGADHMRYEDVERRMEIFLNTEFIGKHYRFRVDQIKDLEDGKEISQSPLLNKDWENTI